MVSEELKSWIRRLCSFYNYPHEHDIMRSQPHASMPARQLAPKNEGLKLIVPCHTHLQLAQPVLPQHRILAFGKQLARDVASRLLDRLKRMDFFPVGVHALSGTGLPLHSFTISDALGFIAPMRNRARAPDSQNFGPTPNKDNHEGSGRGWIGALVIVGLGIGVMVGWYSVYKTGQAIEREIVETIRDWKEAGFPALVKIDKVGLKFSIY